MATRRKPSTAKHARAAVALDLVKSAIVGLRGVLVRKRYAVRAYAVGNNDSTVDGAIHTVGSEEISYRDAINFLEDIEDHGPGSRLHRGKLVPFGGLFDPWLFKNAPTGYLFFSYRFRFLLPGELTDDERRRLKRRRYVPRVTAGREAYEIPVPMGWMNAGPDAVPPGRWHAGHVAASDGALDGMFRNHPKAKLVGIEFRCRWTPDSRTPSRLLC